MTSGSNNFTRRAVKAIKKFVVWAVVSLIVIAGCVGAFWWWSTVEVFATSRFDRAKWTMPLTDEAASSCYRGGMARDVQRNLLKPGVLRANVEALLGAPDYDRSTSVEYGYVLGMCSGFRIDFDVLHVYFDAQGAVEGSTIVQH